MPRPLQYSIGGNAALMADTIKRLQPAIDVLLVGPVGPNLKSLLHNDIATPSYNSHDEVHMILEYPKGSRWGLINASCANRVIFSNDMSNSQLIALEQFSESLFDYKPNLVILSGAHLLDSQPSTFQTSRLRDISNLLDSISKDIPVHWELATVGDMSYFKQLSNTLFTRIDSLGLNEQELRSAAISANANFPSIPSKPSVGLVSDLLVWLMNEYTTRPHSRLSRVHFHTLTFHIIATLNNGPWTNNKASVMAGARIAGLQACHVKNIQSDMFELRMNSYQTSAHSDHLPYHPDTRVKWTRGNVNFELSPVLVCKKPLKTVGLGDAISSIGLLYSNFNNI